MFVIFYLFHFLPNLPQKKWKKLVSSTFFHPSGRNSTLITKDSVMQIIDGLKPKSSTGVDNISNKLLKSAKTFIVSPLTIIINQMFQVGKFPDLLKISKVLPIYKKDDDSLFSNYRPISLLPSISKIFERAIMIQLTEYLENNKLKHSN